MIKSSTFRGVKVLYELHYDDGLPFVKIEEVSKDGQVLDLSLSEEENIKSVLYGQEHLSKLFEKLGNRVSAEYWREK